MKMTRAEAGRLGGLATRTSLNRLRVAERNREIYSRNPKRCIGCGIPIAFEKRKNDFCSQGCSATFCNHRRYNTQPRKHGYPKNCEQCGIKLDWNHKKFCSYRCQRRYDFEVYIIRWKAGEEPGYNSGGGLNSFLRRYIFETRGRKCEQCGWAKVHPTTGNIPVTIDHIDGKWDNCIETNLRVLCPNCHALTPTFAALNLGNGRPQRRAAYKSIEERRHSSVPRAPSS